MADFTKKEFEKLMMAAITSNEEFRSIAKDIAREMQSKEQAQKRKMRKKQLLDVLKTKI